MRWCLAVQDQVANDMILGTGAYKRGVTGTVYRPGADAGWGVMTGLAAPTAVRSHYPKPEVTAAIVARAAALRGGKVVGGPTDAPARSVLTDTVAIFADGERGLHWETIAARLVERFPEHYRAATAETVSAQLRAAGVPSVDVKAKGATRKGARLTAILAASGAANSGEAEADHTSSTVTEGDEDAG
jgi:S-DNA-T family DNA segregation ATPase FtsK/SpoIIIE